MKLKQRSARLLRNAAFDLKYGGFAGGIKKSQYTHLGSSWTTNTDYGIMPQLFDGRIKDADVLVDVGCGKGRIINWWLDRGYKNKIVGIDLDDELAERIRRRLKRYDNVRIVTGNALDSLPPDGTVFYLYSPFSPEVFAQFRDRLWEQYHHRGDVTVIYYAPYHLHVFQNDPCWQIEEIPLDLSRVPGNHKELHHHLAVIRMITP